MMRPSLSDLTRRLTSPKLALGLLLAIVALVFLATLVPQRDALTPDVARWADAHPAAEAVVAIVGFHRAFTSPALLACFALLALSTTMCAWRRAKVAARRLALASAMTREEAMELASKPTFSARIASGSSAEALAAIAAAMRGRRSLVSAGDGYVGGGGGRLGILGSPVFHFALVLLLVTIAWGQLTRSEGLMGVAEGESRPNAQESYGVLDSGALHSWNAASQMIAVERVRFDNVIDGIDRGPTPTVVVRGSDGAVLARQEVYPNHPLRYGSLTIHPNDYGLAARVSLLSTAGASLGDADVLVDFSDASPGTTTVGSFELADPSGSTSMIASLTVPLDRIAEGYRRSIPADPRVSIGLAGATGGVVAAPALVAVGQSVPVPGGASLRLDALRYYARLSVVDDSTPPVLLAALLIALCGLACSLLGNRYAAAVVAAEDEVGERLDVWYRDWRGGSAGRIAFESLVREAANQPTDGGDA